MRHEVITCDVCRKECEGVHDHEIEIAKKIIALLDKDDILYIDDDRTDFCTIDCLLKYVKEHLDEARKEKEVKNES